MYIIEILRYGDENLGKHLFGIYNDLDLAVIDAKEYNTYRGGKYPVITATKYEVNKGEPFKRKSVLINLDKKGE